MKNIIIIIAIIVGTDAILVQSDSDEYQAFMTSTLVIPSAKDEGAGIEATTSEIAVSHSSGVKYPIREIINRIVAYFVRHSPSR